MTQISPSPFSSYHLSPMVFLDANRLIVVVIFRIILIVILVIGSKEEVGNELQLLFIISVIVVFHKLDVFGVETSEELGRGAVAIFSAPLADLVAVFLALLASTFTIIVAVTSTSLNALVHSLRVTAGDLSLLFQALAPALHFGRCLITSCSASASLDISFVPGPLPCITFPLLVTPPIDFCGLLTIIMCVTRCV